MDFEKLTLFLRRLSLLKTVIENEGVVSLESSDKGIDVSYSKGGVVEFSGFFDGQTFELLKTSSLRKDTTYSCVSSFSFAFLMADLLGSRDVREVLPVFVGGEAMGHPSTLLENLMEAANIDFQITDDGVLLYGDVLIGYDTDGGSFYLSLGGQKNTYENSSWGVSLFLNGLSDFYPELKDVLPDTDSPLLAGSLLEDDVLEPLESGDIEFGLEPEEPEADLPAAEPVQERMRRKAFSAYGRQDDGVLFELFSLIIPFAEYVKESEDGVYFVLKGEDAASFVKPAEGGKVCVRLSGVEKVFVINSLAAESDILHWVKGRIVEFRRKSSFGR